MGSGHRWNSPRPYFSLVAVEHDVSHHLPQVLLLFPMLPLELVSMLLNHLTTIKIVTETARAQRRLAYPLSYGYIYIYIYSFFFGVSGLERVRILPFPGFSSCSTIFYHFPNISPFSIM